MVAIAAFGSLAPYCAPGRQQRGGQVGDRAANRLRDIGARGLPLLVLDGADAEHQPGVTVVLVDLDDAFCEPERLLHVALGEGGAERALQQVGVLRIGAQRGPQISRCRGRVALLDRMAGGQIIPGCRCARGIGLGRCLRRQQAWQHEDTERSGRDGHGLDQGRQVHVENLHRGHREAVPPVRIEDDLFALLPQGQPLAPLLRPFGRNGGLYRDIPPLSASHIRVTGPAGPLRRNPGDIMVGGP
jgi:hypothetical protein